MSEATTPTCGGASRYSISKALVGSLHCGERPLPSACPSSSTRPKVPWKCHLADGDHTYTDESCVMRVKGDSLSRLERFSDNEPIEVRLSDRPAAPRSLSSPGDDPRCDRFGDGGRVHGVEADAAVERCRSRTNGATNRVYVCRSPVHARSGADDDGRGADRAIGIAWLRGSVLPLSLVPRSDSRPLRMAALNIALPLIVRCDSLPVTGTVLPRSATTSRARGRPRAHRVDR